MEDTSIGRKKTFLVASIFMAFFVGLFLYKVLFLQYPIISEPVENLWTFEVKIQFQGLGGEAIIGHFLPGNDRGQVVLREDFVSRKLYFAIGKENGNTFIEWKGKGLKDEVQLFYRATVQTRPRTVNLVTNGSGEKLPLEAIQHLFTKPEMESVNVEVLEFLKELVGEKKNNLEKVKAIYEFVTEDVATVSLSKHADLIGPIKTRKATMPEKRELFVHLSRLAGVPARVVHGIILEEGARQKKTHSWAEVYVGGKWVPVDVENGFFAQLPENLMILYRGDRPFMASSGVKKLGYSYAIRREKQSTLSLFYGTATKVGSKLHEWSLFSLPVEIQQVFRVILLIPLGALIVSFFRNVVGVNTFGTFMPVLIALAFRNTRLGWGLVLFSIVVVFAFPEVLFALIGIQILLGRYTGYRLTEYYRFHSFIKQKKEN